MTLLQRVAKDLKESTKKLCRQLQKKPDVEGNATQVKSHKNSLSKIIKDVSEEMMNGLSYADFKARVDGEFEEAQKNEMLKVKEKELIAQIQHITAEHKRQQNEFTKEAEEND